MILHWPQITVLVFMCIGIGLDIQRHGELREGKYNVFSTIVSNIVTAAILYFGGFWK